jgi:hypothetical protein
MDPVFVEKLKAASAEAGVALPLTSGFRSQEKQNQLRAEAVKKYGSEEAASKWVAKTSIHTTGNAADFSMGGDAKKFWDSNPKLVEAMEKQGLHRPLGHEAWHWESDVTKGQERKGLAAKLIEQRNASLSSGSQPQSSPAQTAQGVATGVPAMLAAQGVPGAGAVAGAVSKAGPIGTKSSEMMKSVYQSFITAGFSENQAKALTAEAGRENDFSAKTIFGAHTDAANSAKNIGYFSWQGKRATALQAELEKKGLWKDGKAVQSQETLDTMAKFAKTEMESGQYKGIGNFLENKNVDSETAAKQLGKGYIKWAYGQDVLSSGKAFDWRAHDSKRKGYYDKIDQLVSSGKATPQQGEQMKQQVTADANKEAQMSMTAPANAANISPVPGSAQEPDLVSSAKNNLKEAAEMLGIPEDAMTQAGQGMAFMVNQQNAIPAAYRNNPPRAGGGSRSQRSDHMRGRRANSDPQPAMSEAFTRQTFTGSVPPPASIPAAGPVPPDISSLPARAQQNFRLLGNPNVQAVLDTLQAGGSNIMGAVNDTASRLGVDKLPDIVKSGISSVDKIRTSGGLDSMLGGNLSDVFSRVAPELSSFPGLQSVFDRSVSGASGFARQFKDATGNFLGGTNLGDIGSRASDALGSAVDSARDFGSRISDTVSGSDLVDKFKTKVNKNIKDAGLSDSFDNLGSRASDALGSLGSSASNFVGGLISPQSSGTSGPLESAIFGDKQNDINVASSHSTPSQSGGSSGGTKIAPERGSSVMAGNEAPLEVRNAESSIRRLTDMLLSFSFG